jgi:NhaP-type Na+/H+ or K+/H+ antiporter
MVLSKRERILAIAMIVVVGGLVLNTFIVNPLAARREATANEKLELEAQVVEAQNVFAKRKNLERRWKSLLTEESQNDTGSESRIARALTEWSRQTRLNVTSVKPDRTTSDKGVNETTFVLAGRGSLDAVASFLYRVETSELPVKVVDMQLGSSSESGDSMSLQLRLSAISLNSASKTLEKPSLKQPSEANDEEQLL